MMKQQIKLLLVTALLCLTFNDVKAQEGFIGEVRMFAGNFAPRNWAFCEGQLMAISQNSALFSILGTMYGGDGRTTFALPDLRGRVAMGVGNGPGLSPRNQGQKLGQEYVTLNNLNLPSHTHTATQTSGANIQLSQDNAVRAVPQAGDVLAVPNFSTSLSTQQVKLYGPSTNTVNGQAISAPNIGNTGANQPVNNIQPSTTIRFIICLYGIFPSRN